ncbi:Methyltransferase domain-containing protein [Oryzisolibacter propanilivorax]|uniref:Methyltransferase domain-containing protein n=1 Tax=Oryzisolibacter propanilivorax TaxID=1527607 RepID=A0A1G9SZH6_9BURK|nr:class I SAM-dependent methyltransferase [Oryzisolibacter propanilivorax]SDM40265.1 Methyltransferase domain-containing protein [Oryzisolibacter propanilivorax]
MQSASEHWFDEAYYRRYYLDPKTSVADPQHLERLAAFVCHYLRYLRLPVERVLDVGCGIGLWQPLLARHLPGAQYQGVEFSEHLCARHGWQQGSAVDYAAPEPFDFVICQGVLPYLNPRDLQAALANLARLTRGALYLEAVTREDYEAGTIDEELTDPRLHRHRAQLYRRGLAPHFINLGGGLWLRRDAQVPLFALETLDG